MPLTDEPFPIPSGEHVLVHARLKGLATNSSCSDYVQLTRELLDSFRATKAISIAVPTFTYSFTNSLTFSAADSVSEVGRFSEEVRKLAPVAHRTLDPIFSVVDVDDFGWAKELNHDAFGENSLWRQWQDLDAVIVNLDLPHIVATQFHFIEKLANVPYRFDKTFSGEIIDANGRSTTCDYNYYVRNLDIPSTWNRVLLKEEIRRAGKLYEFQWQGVQGSWFRAKEVEGVLLPIMSRDPQYLLDDAIQG